MFNIGAVYSKTGLAEFQQGINVVEQVSSIEIRASTGARKQHDHKTSWGGKDLFGFHIAVNYRRTSNRTGI